MLNIRRMFFVFLLLFINFSYSGSLNFGSRYIGFELKAGAILNIDNTISDFGGKIFLEPGASVTGQNITLNDGILENNIGSARLTAVYIPSTKKISALSGQTNLVGGTPWLEGNIALTDSSTTLTVAMQGALNQSIELNGGRVVLDNDLKLADEKTFIGLGSIDVNGHTLDFGGLPLTFNNALDWYNASDIRLWSRIALNNTFSFFGSDSINGNCNVLDVSGGGALRCRSGNNLYLTDIVYKGLGTGFGGLYCDNNTATIYLSNVTIELDNDYTTTTGNFIIDGSTTVIVKDYTWTFTGNSVLTVDGMTLWKDKAGAATYGDIDASGANLSLINDGRICYLDCFKTRIEELESCCESVDLRVDELESASESFDSRVGELESCCESVDSRVGELESCCESMDSKVDGLELCCALVKIDVTNLESCCETMDTRVDELESCCESVDSRVDELESASESFDSRVGELESCCETMDTRVDELESCCESMDSRVDELESASESFDSRVGELESCCESVDLRVDELESCCESMDSRVDELESASESFDSRVGELESCCESVDSRVDELEFCCIEVQSEIEGLKYSVAEGVISRVEKLESCCDTVNSRLYELESCCESVDSRVDELESCCESMDSRVDELESCCEHVNSHIEDLESCCEMVQSKIDVIYPCVDVTVTITCDGITFNHQSMLQNDGDVLIFNFACCSCDCTACPKLIFDTNTIVNIPANAKLRFTGRGIVEVRDGVQFIMNGTNDSDKSCLIIDNNAEMKVSSDSGVYIKGIGRVRVMNFGSIILDQFASRLIFGDAETDLLDLRIDNSGIVKVNSEASVLSFATGEFDILLNNNGILAIHEGDLQINNLDGIPTSGYLKRFIFLHDSRIEIINKDSIFNGGVLILSDNRNNQTTDFNNLNGDVGSGGKMYYLQAVCPVNRQNCIDSGILMQKNFFAGDLTMKEMYMHLGYLVADTRVANTAGGSVILEDHSSQFILVNFPDESVGAFYPGPDKDDMYLNRDATVAQLEVGIYDVAYDAKYYGPSISVFGEFGLLYYIDRDGKKRTD